ncbi:hypothetical protein J437_LFUL010770 [Ladona fulva]|uniref:Reverse transcriptase domain-containing protein n=1 Tax=Ladona fulva TaxID=123851 RepID=A0A8K0P116_LADFU|nr:hypothetical protein J437_LFUL010770 [Ladona fulva]
MVRDYLKDRVLMYETKSGSRTKDITAGVAQGSILGPNFWNVLYDSLLRTDMPEKTFLVGYSDDIAAVIEARNPELAQLQLNKVMRRVNAWMENHGLHFALSKTDIVMLTRKRICTIIEMRVGSEITETKVSARYLGVEFDSKLTFWPQIKNSSDKAAATTVSLSRLMANVGSPKQCKRKLLMAVVESQLLYGVEIWASALNTAKYRKSITVVQRRGALRVACSYRTVSEAAVLVIAGTIPIDLLAKERKQHRN